MGLSEVHEITCQSGAENHEVRECDGRFRVELEEEDHHWEYNAASAKASSVSDDQDRCGNKYANVFQSIERKHIFVGTFSGGT